jgi:type II secretory pathway pseudopilin PulG
MRRRNTHGFSLIQMAMLVAVLGIIMASVLPGGRLSSDAQKQALTLKRMAAIEEASKAFMTINLRRPCPGPGGQTVNNSLYGMESPNPGTCNTGSPSADFIDAQTATGTVANGSKSVTAISSFTGINVGSPVTSTHIPANSYVASIDKTNNAITLDKAATGSAAGETLTFSTYAAGTVPVKALGLPDEYGMDGYGRRIMYIVDKRATIASSTSAPGVSTHTFSSAPKSCYDLQSQGIKGAIKVYSTATDTVPKDYVMSALISYGKAGNGAFPAQGSNVASRINATIPTADSNYTTAQINAFVDSSFVYNAATTFTGELVQQTPDPASPYNTTVWYSDDTKNTCCIGKACSVGFDFKMPNNAANADNNNGVAVAVGDINGDGIKDLVIGDYEYDPTNPRVYVIFGSKTGWPVIGAPTLTDISGGDGTYGFYITNTSNITNFAKTIAVGDVNQDGYDDIIINGSTISVVFGAATFGSASINTSALNGANGMLIRYNPTGTPQAIAVGDIKGDGYKSIIFSGDDTNNWVWVVFDKAMSGGSWDGIGVGAPKTFNVVTNTNTTRSFRFTADATYLIGHGMFSIASGDVNGDGVDDIIMGDYAAASGVIGTATGRVYVLFGPFTPSATTPPAVDITTFYGNTAKLIRLKSKAAGEGDFGITVATADMNGDGCKDIIIGGDLNIYGYNGRNNGTCAGTWTDNYNLNAFATWIISTANSKPAWITSSTTNIIRTADVNGDGKPDLLLGMNTSGAPTGCSKHANVGSVYAVLQPSTGWASGNLFTGTANTACDAKELNTTSFPGSFRIDGPSANNADYAYIPATGDINKDGRPDIFIGAPGYSSNKGAVFTLLGRKTVPWESVVDLNSINY